MSIELLHRAPGAPNDCPPLLFAHGAFIAAWCWDEHFLPWFAGWGYDAYALSLRGHGRSAGHATLHTHSIADFMTDVASAASSLPMAPVIIGHSMGGFVLMRYLEEAESGYPASGAAFMSTVPHTGLAGAAVEMAMRDPALFGEVGMAHALGAGFGSLGLARRVLFSNNLSDEETVPHFARMQEESARARMDMMGFDLPNPSRARSVPMLFMGGSEDAFFPPGQIAATAAAYGERAIVLDNLAHAMMLDREWERAALAIAGWLDSVFGDQSIVRPELR